MDALKSREAVHAAAVARGKLGGRPKHKDTKEKREMREIAKAYGPEAIKRLRWLMRNGENHAVQIAAADKLLDRGFGKPAFAEGENVIGPVRHVVSWLSDDVAESGPPRQIEGTATVDDARAPRPGSRSLSRDLEPGTNLVKVPIAQLE